MLRVEDVTKPTSGGPSQPLIPQRSSAADQLVHADGLADVVIHAGLQAHLPVALHGVGRHGDDARPLRSAGQRAQMRARRLQPVHLRHLHVHQHHVVGLALDRLDGFQAVGGDVRPVAHLREQAQRQLLVDGVVLGQQDAQRMPRAAISGSTVGLAGAACAGWSGCAAAAKMPIRTSNSADGRIGLVRQAAKSPGSMPRLWPPNEESSTNGRTGTGSPRRCSDGADRGRQRHAVHLGHLQVEDGQVEGVAAAHPVQRLVRRSRCRGAACPSLGSAGSGCAGWWRCRPRSGRACRAARGCSP